MLGKGMLTTFLEGTVDRRRWMLFGEEEHGMKGSAQRMHKRDIIALALVFIWYKVELPNKF